MLASRGIHALLMRMKKISRRHNGMKSIIDPNLISRVFLYTQAPTKIKLTWTKGWVIDISSIVEASKVGQANYFVVKAIIIGFTKSISREYAYRGITINVIAPGIIISNMTQKLIVLQRLYMLLFIVVFCSLQHSLQ